MLPVSRNEGVNEAFEARLTRLYERSLKTEQRIK